MIYIGENNFDSYRSKYWTVKINFHTLAGGSVIFDKCYRVWRTVAIKFWHLWTCKLVWGNIWRNDITQFMSGVPETGNEIQKCFYISVPYFPGLSESFKKIFKYTPVQVCFKGVNTLKSMLMHPKDKISSDQKKDLVYHWECKADGCNSSYIGETSRALGKRVKEHSKSTTSAILKHCKDFHHPLPSIEDFNIIDKNLLKSPERPRRQSTSDG